MIIAYKPKYFHIEEFIYPGLYNKYSHNENVLWGLLNPNMLWTLDKIRERFNRSVVVNDWKWRQDGFTLRGLRPFDSNTGAYLSTHKFGLGVDFHISGIDSGVIREEIKKTFDKREEYKYITCIEDFAGMSWVHIDFRNLQGKRLLIVGK